MGSVGFSFCWCFRCSCVCVDVEHIHRRMFLHNTQWAKRRITSTIRLIITPFNWTAGTQMEREKERELTSKWFVTCFTSRYAQESNRRQPNWMFAFFVLPSKPLKNRLSIKVRIMCHQTIMMMMIIVLIGESRFVDHRIMSSIARIAIQKVMATKSTC